MLFLLPVFLQAQTGTALFADTARSRHECRLGVRYVSDYQFMGRTDSVKAPYASPTFRYIHAAGFAAGAGLSILTSGDAGRLDVFSLSAGYEKYGIQNAFGISVRQYFYNEESEAVQSEMSTYLKTFAGHDFSLFVLYADLSLGLSEGVDVFTGLEVSRIFRPGYGRVRLVPSLLVQAGTQAYYEEYVVQRSPMSGGGKNGGSGSGMGMPASGTVTETTSSGTFELLDLETGLQASYTLKKTRFFTSGTWVIPFNPVTITSDLGTFEEPLRSAFYWEAGLRYSW